MKTHVKDPVCGTDVEKKSERSETYGTSMYFFCSDKCRSAFKKDPQNYIPQTG